MVVNILPAIAAAMPTQKKITPAMTLMLLICKSG
jgi:hypothetical protein